MTALTLQEIQQLKHKVSKAILYVDDDSNLLFLIKKFLEEHGDIRVHTRSTVKQALELLETTPIDLIISDFVMPETSGLEFYQLLKAKHLMMPFILFTGSKQSSLDQELISMEDILVIEKSDTFDNHAKSFKHRIRTLLRQYEI